MSKKDIFYYTKRKIIGTSIIIVFLWLFIFALITQFLYSSRLFSHIDKQLIEQKEMILAMPFDIFEENRLPFSDRLPFKELPPRAAHFIIAVYTEDTLIGISPNAYFTEDDIPLITAISETSNNTIERVQYNGYDFRGIRFRHNKEDVQLLINVDSELQSVKQLSNTITMSLVALIIIALMLSALLAARIIKPVREAYDKQVYFVQDASHEMRTPLAVIKGKLEILANSWGESIDENFEHISKMMSEVRGLEKLNNNLLLLTKEDIDFTSNITEFKITQFIDDISEFYIDLAEVQNKEISVIKPNVEIMVQWDYDRMKRIVVILLENAFKYTPVGGRIQVGFGVSGKSISIVVKDNGIGIKEEDQGRIFDRFFRSSDVRAKNINGSGIGLSLLKSISKTLGITIKFSSKYGEGTEFRLLVPKIMK